MKNIVAQTPTQNDDEIREKTQDEYVVLMDVLQDFLEDFFVDPEQYITQEELMQERAVFALNWAFSGYGITLEDAVEKIRNTKTGILTLEQINEREMFLDVIDNLVDFAVAEEYQMLQEIQDEMYDVEDYDAFLELSEDTCKKYNSTYASVENADIMFSMGVAATLMAMGANQILTYTTQGDERVRDSHRALEGISYPKSQFPAELIPPIDWGCRCYLTESGDSSLVADNPSNVDELIEKSVNPIFKSHPAVDGKVFSDAHPYFNVKLAHIPLLKEVSSKIKKNILDENDFS